MASEQTNEAPYTRREEGKHGNVEGVRLTVTHLLKDWHFMEVPFTSAGCYGNSPCVYVAAEGRHQVTQVTQGLKKGPGKQSAPTYMASFQVSVTYLRSSGDQTQFT